MKTVSFSLVNPPEGVGADEWAMHWGAQTPYSEYFAFWIASPFTLLADAIVAQLEDDDKYIRVQIFAARERRYVYELTDPFTFETDTAYTWDAAANTLTKTPPPPSESDWLDSLVSFWASFSNTMTEWAGKAKNWIWPLDLVAPLVISVSAIVDGIFTAFFDFRIFWRAFVLRVADLLDWQTILDGLKEALSNLGAIWAWFSNWVGSVKDVIATWWAPVADTVMSWIATATAALPGLLDAWNNFATNIIQTLFDADKISEWWKGKLVDIGDLIKSAFTERADLWQGWTDFRQSVSDFFADPLEWLLARFTDWFLGRE